MPMYIVSGVVLRYFRSDRKTNSIRLVRAARTGSKKGENEYKLAISGLIPDGTVYVPGNKRDTSSTALSESSPWI